MVVRGGGGGRGVVRGDSGIGLGESVCKGVYVS